MRLSEVAKAAGVARGVLRSTPDTPWWVKPAAAQLKRSDPFADLRSKRATIIDARQRKLKPAKRRKPSTGFSGAVGTDPMRVTRGPGPDWS